MPDPDPLRSPVDGTLEEALAVALEHQRQAAGVHLTWPVGVSWSTGDRSAWVQWAHDLPGEEAPAGFLGLLEVGVPLDAASALAGRLAPLGFDPEPVTHGSTAVLAWAVDDEPREVAGGPALLDLLARCARAAGAPARGVFEVYPDAGAVPAPPAARDES